MRASFPGRRILVANRENNLPPKFTRISPQPRHQWVLAPLRIPRPAMDPAGWRGRSGDTLLRLLTRTFLAAGGQIRLNTKASHLLFDNDRCVGVEAISANQNVQYRGRAVVLAVADSRAIR